METVYVSKEDGFKHHGVSCYTIQNREWLDSVANKWNMHLQTHFKLRKMDSYYRRVRINKWDSANRTMYQFHGCLFHGHRDCSITWRYEINPINHKPLADL